MKPLLHPTLCMGSGRALLVDGALLGTDLDAVLEGYDETPVAPEPTHEGVTLPPVSAEERAAIEQAERDAKGSRERTLFVIERRNPVPVEPRPMQSPSERAAAARAVSLERIARENETKRARVREVIAKHLATKTEET